MPIFDPNDPQFSQSSNKLSFEDMVDAPKVKLQMAKLFGESFKTVGKLAQAASGTMGMSFSSAFNGLFKEGSKTFSLLFKGVKSKEAAQGMSRAFGSSFSDISTTGQMTFGKMSDAMTVSFVRAFAMMSREGNKSFGSLFKNANSIEEGFLNKSDSTKEGLRKRLEGEKEDDLQKTRMRGVQAIEKIKSSTTDEGRMHELVGKKREKIARRLHKLREKHDKKIAGSMKGFGMKQAVLAKGGAAGMSNLIGMATKLAGSFTVVFGVVAAIVALFTAFEGEMIKLNELGLGLQNMGLIGFGSVGGALAGPALDNIQKLSGFITKLSDATGQGVPKIRAMAVQLGEKSPEAMKKLLEDSGESFLNFAGMMGLATTDLGGIFNLVAEQQASLGLSTDDLLGIFGGAEHVFKKVGVTFTTMLSTILGLQTNLQTFDRTGTAAAKIVGSFFPMLRKLDTGKIDKEGKPIIGLPPEEAMRMGEQFSKILGSMGRIEMAKALTPILGRIPKEEDIAKFRKDPMAILRGMFELVTKERPNADQFTQLVMLEQRMKAIPGLSQMFTSLQGPEFLSVILQNIKAKTKPLDTDIKSFGKEYDDLVKAQLKAKTDRDELRTAGFKGMQATVPMLERILNWLVARWTEFNTNFASQISRIVNALYDLNPFSKKPKTIAEQENIDMQIDQRTRRGRNRSVEAKGRRAMERKFQKYYDDRK